MSRPAGASTSASERQADELLLSIGGVVGHLELTGAPPTFVAQARQRYDAFTMPPAPQVLKAFTLRLRFDPARPPRAPAAARRAAPGAGAQPQPFEARPLAVVAGDRSIEVERWDFGVRLGAETARGEPRFAGSGRCDLNPFALDSLLRVLWSIFLPRAGGALVHACGLRNGELAVVFPGPSGAGKSTLARKMPDADDVLSDEIVALRPGADGWRVHGTPFWGDFARGGISMRSWPLRGLGFLVQADAVAMAPLEAPEALLRLLSCFVCFQTDRATVERNLAVAARLCADVPAVEARTARDTHVVEVFRKLGPSFGAAEAARKAPPITTREMISEFRAILRKHRKYAFKPRGASMRPFLKSGDALFIQAAGEGELSPGDILLYWTPGRTPEHDALTCHRLVARVPALRGRASKYLTKGDALSRIERFEHGKQSEILGKVSAISRDGKTWKVPGRVGSLARLFGSLVTMPILRMTGR